MGKILNSLNESVENVFNFYSKVATIGFSANLIPEDPVFNTQENNQATSCSFVFKAWIWTNHDRFPLFAAAHRRPKSNVSERIQIKKRSRNAQKRWCKRSEGRKPSSWICLINGTERLQNYVHIYVLKTKQSLYKSAFHIESWYLNS